MGRRKNKETTPVSPEASNASPTPCPSPNPEHRENATFDIVQCLFKALETPRVQEVLMEVMGPMLDLIVEEKVNKAKNEMKEEIEKVKRDCRKETNNIKLELEKLKSECEELKAYSYREDLIIKGLQVRPNADGKEEVMKLFHTEMGLSIPPNTISTVHPLPTKSALPERSERPNPPPIVVRFAVRDARNAVYHSRMRLKGKGIFIDEHLTPLRGKAMALARRLKRERKIEDCWTNNGKLLARLRSGKVVSFNAESELLSHTTPAHT